MKTYAYFGPDGDLCGPPALALATSRCGIFEEAPQLPTGYMGMLLS